MHRAGLPDVGHRFRCDDRVNLYSVAKTFPAVALGMACAEGRLDLDERFLAYFPELGPVAADGFAEVTLRHLVTMTSGTSHKWFAHERIDAPDLLQDIVAAPLVAEPGQRFAYTGSGPYALGRVVARATGADLRSYLMPRLFRPLDLHDPAWHACPLGYPFAESELYLRTGELARFAQLLLQDGVWNGRRIVPAGWVERMTADAVSTSDNTHGKQFTYGYGLGVWLDRGGRCRMDGHFGQYAVIDPLLRAAVTVTAHSEGDDLLLDAIHELVLDPIAGA